MIQMEMTHNEETNEMLNEGNGTEIPTPISQEEFIRRGLGGIIEYLQVMNIALVEIEATMSIQLQLIAQAMGIDLNELLVKAGLDEAQNIKQVPKTDK